MKNIVINGKNIVLKPINFEAICELEDLGFDVKTIGNKTFSSLRCAVAYNMDIDTSEASKIIEEHITNGGKLGDFTPLLEAITNSDFFKAMIGETKNK